MSRKTGFGWAMVCGLVVLINGANCGLAVAQDKEAIVNLYLHCDKKNDNATEKTDEIYIMGTYAWPGGSGVIKVAPKDFQESGEDEREQTYHGLAKCTLKPGESMKGKIFAVDDDGHFEEIAKKVGEEIKKIPAIGDKDIDTIIDIAKKAINFVNNALSVIGKHGDDVITGFEFEVKNESGELKFSVKPDAPKVTVEAPGGRVTSDGRGVIQVRKFNAKNECDYRGDIWEGVPVKHD